MQLTVNKPELIFVLEVQNNIKIKITCNRVKGYVGEQISHRNVC